jgi:glycosyltransferase involved in cell wall biosynthesis
MNSLINQKILVTIFIPVYNGEKYIEQTLNSIKNQTYTNFEVLLVDDSSTDTSLEIVVNFAECDSRFKIFVKKNGGSVAHSTNFIMSEIQGEFFFYSSQDDLFSADLLEQMIERQQNTEADCVLPEMEFYFENTQLNKRIVGFNGNKYIKLTGREACLASLDWTIHGFALLRSTLVKAEFFPEDAFDSDEYITRKLFIKSNKVVFSDGVFYYRQDNINAITKTFTTKNFYVLNTSWRLHKLLVENDFGANIIYQSRIGLVKQYLNLITIYEVYNFDSELEQKKTKAYLIQFKKEYLKSEFCTDNLKHIVRKFKWKYGITLLLLNSNFLRRFFFKFNLMKH